MTGEPLTKALRDALQGLEVKDDDGTLAAFGHDESDQGDFAPQLVVFARDTEEVARVVRACVAHKVPLTPVGARSVASVPGARPAHRPRVPPAIAGACPALADPAVLGPRWP